MKTLTMILAVVGLGMASLNLRAVTLRTHVDIAGTTPQEEHGAKKKKKTSANDDIAKLYKLVRQARADLEALRVKFGIPRKGKEGRSEGRGEHGERQREGRGEHGERRREGGEHGERRREGGEHGERRREGRGEHGEGRGERDSGEEGGKRVKRNGSWSETRNGAHLILAYSPATQSFKGTVQNTTSKVLSRVRVEVHLSNGVELGPTKPTDLKPGAKILVELSAANQKFTWWTTHPEHGNEEGHGPGETEGDGEHGKRAKVRPIDPALRPLYNQLQLLRHEIKTLTKGLQAKKR